MRPGEGIPLDRFLLLPLDITTPHELPFPVYQQHVDNAFQSTASPSNPDRKPPIQHFTSCFFERTREVMLEFGKDAMEVRHASRAIGAELRRTQLGLFSSTTQSPCGVL
jgi:hypothetical protein